MIFSELKGAKKFFTTQKKAKIKKTTVSEKTHIIQRP